MTDFTAFDGINAALWFIALGIWARVLKSFGLWQWIRATWQQWDPTDPVTTNPVVAYDSETPGWTVMGSKIIPVIPAWDGSGWEPVYHEGEAVEPEPEVKITRPKRKRRPKP